MTDETELKPTDEQVAILDEVRGTGGNLLVNALPGTGKTSTIGMIQAISPEQPVLCLAFNKKIATAMEDKFGSTTTVRTINGLGHRIMMKAVPSLTLDKRKTNTILQTLIKELKGRDQEDAWDAYNDILDAVGLAKALGYVPDGKFPHATRLISMEDFHARLDYKPTPLFSALIDSTLIESIRVAYKGAIDFNDQVYMPALFLGTFPRFPSVLVDEDQDLSPVNIAMLKKLVKGRLGAVGDRWQSIYGFRGADIHSIDRLKAEFNCKEFDLSVSFRCPQAVVEAARWRAPNFKWVKPGGKYQVLKGIHPADIPEEAAIICRNNAPLFRCALGLLSSKRSVNVAGSEVGPKILRLMAKLGEADTDQDGVFILIDDWQADKLSKAQGGGQQTIHDMADCMRVFASYGQTLSQAIAYAEHLFEQQGSITLTTGHKSKGLEWDIVYHLDPGLIRDEQDEQEKNLRFVITTRAKKELYEINSKDIAWSQPQAD